MKLDGSISIIPDALIAGDTIAFISPSQRMNRIFTAPLARAKQYLEKIGFKVITIFDDETSATFEAYVLQRCEELHSAFRDSNIKAVFCTIGGSTANQLVSSLDYELIKSNPKIFCGFSDITVLHCAIYTQTGLRTYYGPTVIDGLGSYPEPHSFTSGSLIRTLTEAGRQPLGSVPMSSDCATDLEPYFLTSPWTDEPRAFKPNVGWKWLREGSASGRIFGGCLRSLMHLPGTKYWPKFHGRIFFLETSMAEDVKKGVPLPEFSAQMTDLRNLGVFDDIIGLIIGRPYGYADGPQLKKYEEVILNQARGHSFPILMGVDIGHTAPMLTVPLDALVELNSNCNRFSILDTSVS